MTSVVMSCHANTEVVYQREQLGKLSKWQLKPEIRHKIPNNFKRKAMDVDMEQDGKTGVRRHTDQVVL